MRVASITALVGISSEKILAASPEEGKTPSTWSIRVDFDKRFDIDEERSMTKRQQGAYRFCATRIDQFHWAMFAVYM